MTSGDPTAVAWLQATATILIAGFVAYIGYRQWRTERERVVLDLFEKRFEVIGTIRSTVSDVLREATAPPVTAVRFFRDGERAKYLFGPQVTDYLTEVYGWMINLNAAQRKLAAQQDPDRAKWADREAELLGRLTGFFATFNPLVEPYMRMHQQAPFSFSAWWRKRKAEKSKTPPSG